MAPTQATASRSETRRAWRRRPDELGRPAAAGRRSIADHGLAAPVDDGDDRPVRRGQRRRSIDARRGGRRVQPAQRRCMRRRRAPAGSRASRPVQPKRHRCVPGRAAPTQTIAHVPSAEAGPGGGAPEGARRPYQAADRKAARRHGRNRHRRRPASKRRRGGSRQRRHGQRATRGWRTRRLCADSPSCRAGRTGGLRGASERADLRHAATADAVGTGGAFAPASSRAGSRRPRTIFCRRLRLSDQLAMCEGWGGPLPRRRLAPPPEQAAAAPARGCAGECGRTGRSPAAAARRRAEGRRGFMPRRSRPRSRGAAGRDGRTRPSRRRPGRSRRRNRRPTI